jgi:hypothetical protein
VGITPSVRKAVVEKNAYPQKFKEFWSVAWYKVGIDKSYAAWEKRRKQGVDTDLLIAAAKIHGPILRQEAEKQDRKPLHPATWLNQGRWLDETVPDPLQPTGPPKKSWIARQKYDLSIPYEGPPEFIAARNAALLAQKQKQLALQEKRNAGL